MDKVTNAIKRIFEELNPFQNDLTSLRNIGEYIVKVGLAAIVLFTVIYILKSYKKIGAFLKDTLKEVNKITWLSRSKTYRYSFLTVIMITFFTLFILLTDQTFLFLRNLLIFPSI